MLMIKKAELNFQELLPTTKLTIHLLRKGIQGNLRLETLKAFLELRRLFRLKEVGLTYKSLRDYKKNKNYYRNRFASSDFNIFYVKMNKS